MKKFLGLVLALVFVAGYVHAQAVSKVVTNRGEVVTVYVAEGGGSASNAQNTAQSVPADFTVGDDLTVADDAAVGGDLAVTGAATVGGSAVVTKAIAAQADTNASTTVTAYVPAFVGQLLLGAAGSTNSAWVARGTTTNDWLKIAP
jgi:hypothetical protein